MTSFLRGHRRDLGSERTLWSTDVEVIGVTRGHQTTGKTWCSTNPTGETRAENLGHVGSSRQFRGQFLAIFHFYSHGESLFMSYQVQLGKKHLGCHLNYCKKKSNINILHIFWKISQPTNFYCCYIYHHILCFKNCSLTSIHNQVYIFICQRSRSCLLRLKSSFRNRLIQPHCLKERHRKSFLSGAIRLYNAHKTKHKRHT